MTLYIKINGTKKITEIPMTEELKQVGAENVAKQFAWNNKAIVSWGFSPKNMEELNIFA